MPCPVPCSICSRHKKPSATISVSAAGEIEDAQWFALDALPLIPPQLSIPGHLIPDTVATLVERQTA